MENLIPFSVYIAFFSTHAEEGKGLNAQNVQLAKVQCSMEFIPTETSQKAYAVSQINIYSSHFHKPQNTSTPLVSMAIQRELLQMGDGGLNLLGSQKSLFSNHLLVLLSNGFHSNSLAAQTAWKCSESL